MSKSIVLKHESRLLMAPIEMETSWTQCVPMGGNKLLSMQSAISKNDAVYEIDCKNTCDEGACN